MEMQDIKSSGGDMSPQTRERVMQIFNDVIQDKEANYPQTLARRLKEQCDIQMKGTWHCHVGPSFGSSFPYERGSYFTASYRDLCVVLYKYG
nr:unnamed protein product [Spirometra erinaceieuropaei]